MVTTPAGVPPVAVTVRSSPWSGSVSLARTAIGVAVSSSVVTASSTASGGSLTPVMVMVTVAVSVAPWVSAAV